MLTLINRCGWTLQKIEWFWRETLICDGKESALDRCRYKINYALPDCMIQRDYVYVRCGARNLPPQYQYWGNIRISFPDYELGDFTAGYSSLSNLDIYGAGILHEEKASSSAPALEVDVYLLPFNTIFSVSVFSSIILAIIVTIYGHYHFMCHMLIVLSQCHCVFFCILLAKYGQLSRVY